MTEPSTDNWFAGSRALVTGAAHGIGRATAETLHRLGASVIALDSDELALNEVFRGQEIALHVADVSGDGEALAREITAKHGAVELLVNNVGIDTPRSFLQLPQQDFDCVFQTNLRGPWFLTRALAQALIDQGQPGAIVFVSSLHDHFIRGYPHYSASKAAVAMLVKELAQELGPSGIRVNAVSPGVIETTNVPAPQTEPAIARIRRLVPLGHVGSPEQVARMIAVLLSEQWAGYVNGANVSVDGGLGAHSWSSDP
jgi:NAD(P)-dependent dehydrogenase (short-subunit alcohol dehydrogenase family)